jgi:hypothetical protein
VKKLKKSLKKWPNAHFLPTFEKIFGHENCVKNDEKWLKSA